MASQCDNEVPGIHPDHRSGVVMEVVATPDPAVAVARADIVCTTTSSREPVLPGVLLEPGMHVNAVGASVPTWGELDEGVIGPDHLRAELGEVLVGAHPVGTSEDEITLFRSLGLAVEDLAAGWLVYRRALERGVGVRVNIGG